MLFKVKELVRGRILNEVRTTARWVALQRHHRASSLRSLTPQGEDVGLYLHSSHSVGVRPGFCKCSPSGQRGRTHLPFNIIFAGPRKRENTGSGFEGSGCLEERPQAGVLSRGHKAAWQGPHFRKKWGDHEAHGTGRNFAITDLAHPASASGPSLTGFTQRPLCCPLPIGQATATQQGTP